LRFQRQQRDLARVLRRPLETAVVKMALSR
jgi:hypothetical protein